MKTLRWLSVPLLWTIGCAGATGPGAADIPEVGVTVHAIDDVTLSALRDLGIRHVRTTLYAGSEGLYHQSGDAALRALASEFDVLVVLRGNPSVDAVRSAVARFPGVTGWQVGNEPDVDGAHSDRFAGPAEYVAYLSSVAPLLPGTVVCAGLTGDAWAAELEDAPCGVLAAHAYGYPVEVQFRDRAKALTGRRPVWATEFGLEPAVVPGVTNWERVQAEEVGAVLALNDAESLYERAYLYVLAGDAHALIRADGTPRPAYYTLRDHLNRAR